MLVLALALLLVPFPLIAHQRLDWNESVQPFRIAGNIYYVGTASIAVYLVTDPQGHVLIDGAMTDSVDQIARNIGALGFRIEDVRYILSTHAHWDHAGGIAALRHMSGARVVSSHAERRALESGRIDYRADLGGFPPVSVDRAVGDGGMIRVGNTRATARLTPGHSRGCTSWTMGTVENDRRLNVIFACSLSVGGQPLVGGAYRTAARDFRRTFDRLSRLRADIYLGSHTSSFGFSEKLRRLQAGDRFAFVDPQELPTQVARARTAFEHDLALQRDQHRRNQ